MITVAAVAIITPIVLNMVTSNLKSGKVCMAAQSDVQIGKDSGFTCKNTTLLDNYSGVFKEGPNGNYSNGSIKIQIKKGADSEVDLVDLKLLISVGGTSYALNGSVGNLPNNNGQRVYSYPIENFTGANGVLAEDVESVSVAPIVKIGNTEEECPSAIDVPLSVCA